MLASREYLLMSGSLLSAVIVAFYFLGLWGFESPNSVAEAAKAGRIRPGMTKIEVVSVLGDHWHKDITSAAQNERWCRWLECISFNQGQLILSADTLSRLPPPRG